MTAPLESSPMSGLLGAVLSDTPIPYVAGPNVLAANASNATILLASGECIPDMIPSVPEYLSAIDFGGVLILCLGLVATVCIFVLFGDCVAHILRHGLPRAKSSTILVISVYPMVAVAVMIASICPRAQLVAEATTQLAFTTSWYNFFCLLLDYSGGKTAILSSQKPQSLTLTPRVPPLCCFWCCMPQKVTINSRTLAFMRCLVLQLPVVQGLIYLVLLVMAAESLSVASAQHALYAAPVMFVSIFTALWGMGMFARFLGPGLLEGFFVKHKMLSLQFVLIFSKLQGLGIRIAGWAGLFPCHPALPPTVFANLVYNTLMMTELVVLMVIAWRLYKRPLPLKLAALPYESQPASKMPSISSVVSERARS
ncbi:organic solute transporter alpha-like protein [Neocloeon triangulifer]|uniref:organic solute transporter alpha-like protein n=1 Tax=Neocloeon triangulifer TaxID=2078957 RepID=UPI00286F2BC8|nr:organic solute transporter alpha-like protein [Neocloeon triangulifer]